MVVPDEQIKALVTPVLEELKQKCEIMLQDLELILIEEIRDYLAHQQPQQEPAHD